MNTSLIVTLNKHNVYYINGNKLSFYLAIPYKDFNNTNISVELYSDYELLNPNNNDSIWIKDEVTRIYKEIDNDNITLLIPIFHDDRLKQTNNIMDQNLYLELDNNISSAINSAYQILTKSNIKVESRINLVNNGKFNNFSRWFLQRYNTRVEHKTYFDLKSNNINSTRITNDTISNISNFQEQKPFDNPVRESNVNIQEPTRIPVGNETYVQSVPTSSNNYNEINNNRVGFVTGNNIEQKVIPPTTSFMNNTPTNESVEVPNANSAGFVSYLLLGIITVIICLGILYIML